MSADTFELISKQTGVEDMLLVERTYYECASDEVKTIFKLMDIAVPATRTELRKKERTVFDDLREICDEKDIIFQNVLANKRN
jgi:hypothetical protein